MKVQVFLFQDVAESFFFKKNRSILFAHMSQVSLYYTFFCHPLRLPSMS
jgi:hypothetical protein